MAGAVEVFFSWLASRDWPLTIRVISDLFVGVAAICGTLALGKWRAELIGRDQYEASKNISLKSFQLLAKFRDAGADLLLLITDPPFGEMGLRREKVELRFWTNLNEIENETAVLREANWRAKLLGMKEIQPQIQELENTAIYLGLMCSDMEKLRDAGMRFLTEKNEHGLHGKTLAAHEGILKSMEEYIRQPAFFSLAGLFKQSKKK